MRNYFIAFFIMFAFLFLQACKKEQDNRPRCEKNKFGKVIFNHFDPSCLGIVYYLVDKEVYKKGFCNDFAISLDSINIGERVVEVQNNQRRTLFIDTIIVPQCNNVLVDW